MSDKSMSERIRDAARKGEIRPAKGQSMSDAIRAAARGAVIEEQADE